MIKYITGIVLLLTLSASNADVLFPLYSSDKFVAGASLEKIFTYEKMMTKNITLMPWAGAAVFWPFYQLKERGPVIPALGIEAALESRWYPLSNNASGLFTGIYGGGAFMFPSYAAIGASTGIKLGYKKYVKIKESYHFCFEPYNSISTLPAVFSTYYKSSEVIYFPGVIYTIGIRFVSQWGKN